MENTIKKKKSFFQRMAELFFAIYLITLYIFVDRSETVIISQTAFILFAGLTVLIILQKQRIHLSKNVMTVYLTFAWMFATVFWAQNEYLAWLMVKTMWQLFLLFFLTYNLFYEKENPHEYLIKCLYIAGIVLLVYSIYTYGLRDVIDLMTGNENARIGKKINQENTFGRMNATTCMMAFYYLLYRQRFKIFHVIIFVLSFLFAMSSGSRTSLLMICIGALFFTYKKYGIRQVYKVIAIVLVLSILFISIIQLPIFETIKLRMEQLGETIVGKEGDSSSKIRANMIEDGWNIFKQRILTGYGADNYRIVSRYRTYSHNNFVEILVDFGLIGFILYYLIYWEVFKNLSTAKDRAGKALLCVFLIQLMMEIATVPYYDKVHWIMMAFFSIKPIKSINNVEGEAKNEIVSEKAKKRYT